MKKIPTLFEREFVGHNVVNVKPNVTPGMEWVLNGEGTATIKIDGSCCAIINGELYKRYDAKNGKPVPEGAIKCQEKADPVTGHLPCWVKCNRENPADKWFFVAYDYSKNHSSELVDATYEAIGLHFNSNPYDLNTDMLVKHGSQIVDVKRTFEDIRQYLSENYIEGLVFWKDGQPQCKIKRSDFGFDWKTKKH